MSTWVRFFLLDLCIGWKDALSYRHLILYFPSAIQKIEQEKTNRDHTIRSLNDEIANQDEVIVFQISTKW